MSFFINRKQHKKLLSSVKLRAILVVLMMIPLSACSGMDTEHKLCDLKVLSLLIPKQTELSVTYGSKEMMQHLQRSQIQLDEALKVLDKKYAGQKGIDELLNDGQRLHSNTDFILKSQQIIHQLYDFKLQLSETIPQIQAEYNLLTDEMSQRDYPATQVIIAKNQVFIAERILRSMHYLSAMNDFHVNHLDDYSADLETFNTYLDAQLNGSKELGVKRIDEAALREGLLSIQADSESIKQSALTIQKERDTLIQVFKHARDNQHISEQMFGRLNQLESNQ